MGTEQFATLSFVPAGWPGCMEAAGERCASLVTVRRRTDGDL